jgi:hypothetical protein
VTQITLRHGRIGARSSSTMGRARKLFKDTAQRPDDRDCVCVARTGRDSTDGLTPNCGVYDANKVYERLDIVTYEGARLPRAAQRAGPTWPRRGLATVGGARLEGDKGAPGPRGPRDDTGAMVNSWLVNCEISRVAAHERRHGRTNAELRRLFERCQIGTSQWALRWRRTACFLGATSKVTRASLYDPPTCM